MSNRTILESVRDFLQLKDVEAFDDQLIPLIDSALNTLNQNGAGNNVSIRKKTDLNWDDFLIIDNKPDVDVSETCQAYTMLKVKQLFDPPAPNTAGYLQSTLDELLWRIHTAYNKPEKLHE